MEIKATEWHRYGQHRTYLTDPEGHRLGWINNKTGELTAEPSEHRSALEEWALAHRPADTHIVEKAPVDQEFEIQQSTELAAESDNSPDWFDLAMNVPGQGVREQATETLDEMKERSRFWTGVARVLDIKTDERAWRKGAEGEETVGARLNRLAKDGWYILHSVPIGHNRSDVDHVVIGFGGVYTINTKNHPGKKIWVAPNQIRVDGFVEPYLRNSRFESQRVRKLLSEAVGWEVPVRPALVFLTGSIIPNVVIKKRPDDVDILDRMDIPGAFHHAPKRLNPEQILQVYEVARRSSTWTQHKPTTTE